jgi:hypothetical protein
MGDRLVACGSSRYSIIVGHCEEVKTTEARNPLANSPLKEWWRLFKKFQMQGRRNPEE